MPAWPPLKSNTDAASNAAFVDAPNPPERAVGVAVALALLRGYKLVVSPFFAGSCRFVPSCSDYARDAMTEHGVMRGTWLAA